MELVDFLNIPQFSLDKDEKRLILFDELKDLTEYHIENCPSYKKIIETVFPNWIEAESIEDIPFIPVSVFKNHELKSIADADVYKILKSSGTTGQMPSKIYLDSSTAKLQTFSLSKIITHIIGNERLPMLIIDSKEVFKDKKSFSARGAGILGLSVFGKDHTYVLNSNFELESDVLLSFLKKHEGKPILIFGFTFMVWQYLRVLKDKEFNLENATLIHSGGWKKLIESSVDNNEFKKTFDKKFNLTKIYNFYGMIEQIGSVFIENNLDYLNAPNFADVIIRNPKDFSVQPHGKEGLIQVVSCLPKSYPGHSILTEDIGVCIGEDDPKNKWRGKYFKIIGRAKKAELRGCSDVFAAK